MFAFVYLVASVDFFNYLGAVSFCYRFELCDQFPDQFFALLTGLWEQLAAATDADGEPLELVRLPMPRAIMHEGERLPASYANFLVINDAALISGYYDPPIGRRPACCRPVSRTGRSSRFPVRR